MSKNKGGRPKTGTTLIQEAVNNRDVDALIWAFIQHSAQEIKKNGKLETFSGNHLVAFVDQLMKSREVKETGISEDEIDGLKKFLTVAK
jgi:hypothetical protein